MRVLRYLHHPVVNASTDVDVFSDLALVEREALRTTGVASPAQVVGQAIVNSTAGYWSERLKRANKNADVLLKYCAAINTAYIRVSALASPTETAAKTVMDTATSVDYWEASIPDDVCGDLKAMLLQKTLNLSEPLVSASKG